MEIFRITAAPFADLSGRGGLFASGRWHSRGQFIVYAAPTRSMCVLERLVHTDPEDVPDNLVLLTIHVPDTLPVEEVSVSSLGPDWQQPLSPACVAAGDAWLRGNASCLLRVPSAILPEEANLLLNPLHPDARLVKARGQRPFSFDPRLTSSLGR